MSRAFKYFFLLSDRTFNLGKCYVTIAVYQNKNLINHETGTYPVCFGMAMLHFEATEVAYNKVRQYKFEFD